MKEKRYIHSSSANSLSIHSQNTKFRGEANAVPEHECPFTPCTLHFMCFIYSKMLETTLKDSKLLTHTASCNSMPVVHRWAWESIFHTHYYCLLIFGARANPKWPPDPWRQASSVLNAYMLEYSRRHAGHMHPCTGSTQCDTSMHVFREEKNCFTEQSKHLTQIQHHAKPEIESYPE